MAVDISQPVYKILAAELWAQAERAGSFAGAGIDAEDGFIHFSTARQARETTAKHFAGRSDLVLVAFDGARLAMTHGDAFRYEPSRGGDLFPHLYGTASTDAVLWSRPLPLGPDGVHAFPDLS